MTTVLLIFAIGFLVLSLAFGVWVVWLNRQVAVRDADVERAEKEAARVRAECEQTISAKDEECMQAILTKGREAEEALAKAQLLVDQERQQLASESERLRTHYETEARRLQDEARAALTEAIKKLEGLQKYADLHDTETQVRQNLADAAKEATELRAGARGLLEQARAAGAQELARSRERAKQLYEQAEARLTQATRDAGTIVAKAEERAQQIGCDAYTALRDKELIEHAAAAIRNIVEGYGDRYVVPTHSILDDLAAEFGYDAAGESLRAARDQSRRMVEQGEAASCDYVEVSRRETAIRFVIHAFNGHVDSLLTRVRQDNFGVLEQKIRDAFSLVNHDGEAFRNARILPAYLDARLAELKWAVVVQELAARAREEQRYQNERRRDEERARKEQEEKKAQAEREEQIKAAALEEAEQKLATVSAEERAKLEQEMARLKQELEEAQAKKLTIAQQTNRGRIYVISNVGSFRDNIYKIGMTRRPADERVDELNGASVPFEFDIHAVIESDDAPALEYKLHQKFIAARVNKVNPRKEFFRVTLDEIRQELEKLEKSRDYLGDVEWTERSRAQQYYETLDIEGDQAKREKWLARERLLANRRARLEMLATTSEDPVEASPVASNGASPSVPAEKVG